MTTTPAQVLPEAILFNAAPAGADHNSYDNTDAHALGTVFGFGPPTSGSIQFAWAGLTGTTNCTFSVVVKNTQAGAWIPKLMADNMTPVAYTVSTANGSELFSLNGVVTEKYYGLKYAHNGVTGGTIDAQAGGKENIYVG